MPNMYARGILFGKMVIELGDTCTAKCEKLGISAEIEFKTKVRHPFVLLSTAFCFCTSRGLTSSNLFLRVVFWEQGFFSGVYNAIEGRIRHGQTDIGEIGGRWSHTMDFKSSQVRHAHTRR